MRFEDLNKDETSVLTTILALAHQLPHPLVEYTEALGYMRRHHFGIGGVSDRGPAGRATVNRRKGAGLPRQRKIRATSDKPRLNSGQ